MARPKKQETTTTTEPQPTKPTTKNYHDNLRSFILLITEIWKQRFPKDKSEDISRHVEQQLRIWRESDILSAVNNYILEVDRIKPEKTHTLFYFIVNGHFPSYRTRGE